MRNLRFSVVGIVAWSSLVAAQTAVPSAQPQSATHTQQPAKETAPAGIDLIWAFKIPMRDGVRLNGTVFKPTGEKAPLPIIFTLTPYISDRYQDYATYFLQHGYIFVLVDVRGRGNSDGVFDPFTQEPNDGHDIVEVLATFRR